MTPESLPHQAARLAHEIRRESPRLVELNYPPKMELWTTCCLHICVDAPNFEDHHVAFCIMQAAKREHPKCLKLALLLARCSYTQRRRANFLAWDWTPDDMERWN